MHLLYLTAPAVSRPWPLVHRVPRHRRRGGLRQSSAARPDAIPPSRSQSIRRRVGVNGTARADSPRSPSRPARRCTTARRSPSPTLVARSNRVTHGPKAASRRAPSGRTPNRARRESARFPGPPAKATEVEILRIGGAAAEQVVVRTEPASVPATGGTAQIIAIGQSTRAATRCPARRWSSRPTTGALVELRGQRRNGEARTTLTTNRETMVRAAVGAK